MSRRAVLRVDAGAGAGLGHLRRSLSLAVALRREGFDSTFVTPADAHGWIREAGCDAVPLAADAPLDVDLTITAGAASRRRADVVVLDSYTIDRGYVGGLRQRSAPVVIIDDLVAEASALGDLVTNGALVAEALPYRSERGDTRFLLGPRYALMAPAFRTASPRPAGRAVQRVLVTVGGADRGNLTPGLIRAIDEIPYPFSIDVVCGPFFDNHKPIRSATTAARHPIRVVEAPSDLETLMAEADLIVTGAGQTLFECARCGVPAVALQIADNQSANLRGFVASGAVVSAGEADAGVAARVAAMLGGLCRDASRREAMAAAGQRLIDGGGAERVAAAVSELIA